MFSELTLTHIRNVRIVCASALIVGFFMPWVSIWGMGIAGYKIPEIAQGLRGFGRTMGTQEDPRFILFLLPYLIPILAFVIIIKLLGQPIRTETDALGVATGIIPFLGLIYGLSQIGGDLFRVLAIGGYWTLLAGAILIAASLDFDTIVRYQQAMLPSENSRRFQSPSLLRAANYELASTYDCPVCGSSQQSNVAACGDCGTKNPHNTIVKEIPESVSVGTQLREASPGTDHVVSEKRFCTQCGKRIGESDNFCSECGSAV